MKERTGLMTVGAVYDALYRRAAAGKLEAETALLPRAQTLAELTEARNVLELQRKDAKTAKDIEKIDKEIAEIDTKLAADTRLKQTIADIGDQTVTLPGVGTWKVKDILNVRPELLDKVIAAAGEKPDKELQWLNYWKGLDQDMRQAVRTSYGFNQFAKLDAATQNKIVLVSERARAIMERAKLAGEKRPNLDAAVRSARQEIDASYSALKKVPTAKRGALREIGAELGVTEKPPVENWEDIKAVVKQTTEVSELDLRRMLRKAGLSDEEIERMINEVIAELR